MSVLCVGDTNMWEGLGEDDGINTVAEKGQSSINSRGSNLLAVGGELRPDKCSYTVHEMKPTKDGRWECVKEAPNKPASKEARHIGKLDGLWEDMDVNELDKLEPPGPEVTMPLTNGDATAIKKLSTNNSEGNLGVKVQPDGCNKRHLSALKDKVEMWTSKVDGSQLPARAMWQSYTQQL